MNSSLIPFLLKGNRISALSSVSVFVARLYVTSPESRKLLQLSILPITSQFSSLTSTPAMEKPKFSSARAVDTFATSRAIIAKIMNVFFICLFFESFYLPQRYEFTIKSENKTGIFWTISAFLPV